MLQKIIEDKMLMASAVVGFYPAVSVGDDLLIKATDKNSTTNEYLHFLRNQELQKDRAKNCCLADFIAPQESGMTDYIGLFAATTGIGIEKWMDCFKENNDDYSAIC